MPRQQVIFAYQVQLDFENQEHFVTFDEPNLFIEPYDIWIKLIATVTFLIGLCGAFIQFAFIFYEANGYAASYRTAINQLVSSSYFTVSIHFLMDNFLKNLYFFS